MSDLAGLSLLGVYILQKVIFGLRLDRNALKNSPSDLIHGERQQVMRRKGRPRPLDDLGCNFKMTNLWMSYETQLQVTL